MITPLLELIQDELDGFLSAQIGADVEVLLREVPNPNELSAGEEEEALFITLLNVERDTSHQQPNLGEPPVHVNLYLLFSAHFPREAYPEALRCVAAVIGFFQGNPNFMVDAQQVRVELVTTDFRELGNIWNALGARQKPSVVFRVRTLTITEDSEF